MKFQYTKLPHGIEWPIIRVVVSHNDKVLPYFAVIDSGADINLFHAELAPLLGLDLTVGERREVGGVIEGERRAYYVHKISLHVGG